MEVPQQSPGAEFRWRSAGKAPRSQIYTNNSVKRRFVAESVLHLPRQKKRRICATPMSFLTQHGRGRVGTWALGTWVPTCLPCPLIYPTTFWKLEAKNGRNFNTATFRVSGSDESKDLFCNEKNWPACCKLRDWVFITSSQIQQSTTRHLCQMSSPHLDNGWRTLIYRLLRIT